MKKNEIFSNVRIQFEQMYDDSISFLQQTYGGVGKYFTSASPFGQLLRVTLRMGELIFYYIEDSITELNIKKATRPSSIRGLAALVGHDPTRAISATGVLKLTYNGSTLNMYGDTVIIPNYTQIKNKQNGLKYLIQLDTEEARINLVGNNSINVKVIQGEIQSQTFTGSGQPLQSFNVPVRGTKHIEQFNTSIYINGEKWKIYDSIYDIPRDYNGCIIKTGTVSGIDVFFGNGNFGMIPENGATIRVEFLLTQGRSGNINVTETLGNWQWINSGYDTQGTEIDLNSVLNVSIVEEIGFGSPAEPLYLTKLVGPKHSRAFVLANPESYIVYLEKLNYFSIIDAFSTFDDDFINDDNVVYLFLVPDINNKLTENLNYFTAPIEYFYLTEFEKEKIVRFIHNSGRVVMTTEFEVLDPIIRKYIINISLITFEGFSKDFIRQQIIDKLSSYFLNNRRRDRIPKSDLINIIENVEGVDSVNVWFMSEQNELEKRNNSEAETVGIDEFGDIILKRGELPLIRGDWEDRNGIYYDDKISTESPGSVNIQIKKTIPQSYNLERHRININRINKV